MRRFGLISVMFVVTAMIGMTFSGCKKDEEKERGQIDLVGVRKFSLHVATLYTYSGFTDLELRSAPDGNNKVGLRFSDLFENEMPAGTYKKVEDDGTITSASLSVDRNIGLGNQIEDLLLVVKKSGNEYDITVTGKTEVNAKEVEFKATYKGKIEVTNMK